VLAHKYSTGQLEKDTQYRRSLNEESNEFKEDIYGGTAYKKVASFTKKLGGSSSLAWADGIQTSKSSMSSITPLAHVINELKPAKRFKHDKIILQALWCSKEPVNYNIMFDKLIPDWIKLREGLPIDYKQKKIVLRHEIIGWILDYVESCKVKFMKQLIFVDVWIQGIILPVLYESW